MFISSFADGIGSTGNVLLRRAASTLVEPRWSNRDEDSASAPHSFARGFRDDEDKEEDEDEDDK